MSHRRLSYGIATASGQSAAHHPNLCNSGTRRGQRWRDLSILPFLLLRLGTTPRVLGIVLGADLVISAITLGEPEHGWQAGFGDRGAAEPFLALVPVLPFDAQAAAGFGMPRPKRRTYDRQTAGHALSLNIPVVT